MIITEGKYYKRRDGKIVGPVQHTKVSFSDGAYWYIQKEAMASYAKNGMKSITGYDKHDHDLVEEITDATLITEVDNRPKFTFECGERK
jgi:protein associated with RNAse G/E